MKLAPSFRVFSDYDVAEASIKHVDHLGRRFK